MVQFSKVSIWRRTLTYYLVTQNEAHLLLGTECDPIVQCLIHFNDIKGRDINISIHIFTLSMETREVQPCLIELRIRITVDDGAKDLARDMPDLD
jgi:hypothetical protein